LGPADSLRRAVRHRASLVKRHTAALRLDALVELLGPEWAEALGSANYVKSALVILEKYADPRALRRLGRRRLAELLIRTSHGAWREAKPDERSRWVALLFESAREAGLPHDAEFRSAFGAYIEWGSRLAVENSQTGAKPPERMPMPHWDWNTAAGPPGSRVSALAPPALEEPTVTQLPAENEAVSFEQHIKPLFRPQDQRSMSFAFDLWSYDDVSRHADAIADRLEAGTMPCDGSWPTEKIEVFRRWLASGKPR
jgi:hypothetical protein